jgi:ribose 1,5-bisphosphokinase PhnN
VFVGEVSISFFDYTPLAASTDFETGQVESNVFSHLTAGTVFRVYLVPSVIDRLVDNGSVVTAEDHHERTVFKVFTTRFDKLAFVAICVATVVASSVHDSHPKWVRK